jgi:hypothetical protein
LYASAVVDSNFHHRLPFMGSQGLLHQHLTIFL